MGHQICSRNHCVSNYYHSAPSTTVTAHCSPPAPRARFRACKDAHMPCCLTLANAAGRSQTRRRRRRSLSRMPKSESNSKRMTAMWARRRTRWPLELFCCSVHVRHSDTKACFVTDFLVALRTPQNHFDIAHLLFSILMHLRLGLGSVNKTTSDIRHCD